MSSPFFLKIFGLVLVAVFLTGCTAGQPTQYLCSDGTTIVTNLADCPGPQVDREIEKCESEPSPTGYFSYDSDRDKCFYELALDRENATICRKIDSTDPYGTYTEAKCAAEIAIEQDDASVCDVLSGKSETDCYAELAKEFGDPTVCQGLSTSTKRDECLLDYAYEIYYEDTSVCEMIASPSKRNDCFFDYVSHNHYYISDWSVCGNFSTVAADRHYCYQMAAETTGELRYCDGISDISGGYSKSSCYGMVARQKSDPGICNQLGTTTEKDDCYYYYSISYPYSVGTCDNIIDDYARESCISDANYSASYYY